MRLRQTYSQRSTVTTVDPRTLPLLTLSQLQTLFHFDGSFTGPSAIKNGGTAAMSITPDGKSLYVAGLAHDTNYSLNETSFTGISRFDLPTLTGTPNTLGTNGAATVNVKAPVAPNMATPQQSYTVVQPKQNDSTFTLDPATYPNGWANPPGVSGVSNEFLVQFSDGSTYYVTLTTGSSTSGSFLGVPFRGAGHLGGTVYTTTVKIWMWHWTIPWAPNNGNGAYLMGSLNFDGKSLLLSGGSYYDNTGQMAGWIIKSSDPNLTTAANPPLGSPQGQVGQTANYTRRWATSLGVVPPEWRPYLGGPCFVGGDAIATLGINSTNSSMGPAFATFDPANVGTSAGGQVPMKEVLNYLFYSVNGVNFPPFVSTQLSFRHFSGPFPLAYINSPGSYTSYTLTGGNGTGLNGLTGATSATLASTFTAPTSVMLPTIGKWPYMVYFSSGEMRVAVMNVGSSTKVPDPATLFSAYWVMPTQNADGTWSIGTTPAPLTGINISNVVQIAPLGDALRSSYSNGTAAWVFVKNTRTILYIRGNVFGVEGKAGEQGAPSCSSGASGSIDLPVPPDTVNNIRLQVDAFDGLDMYKAANGLDGYTTSTPTPYFSVEFPGSDAWRDPNLEGHGAVGCIYGLGASWIAVDYQGGTNRVYMALGNNPFTFNNGQMIMFQFTLNPPPAS